MKNFVVCFLIFQKVLLELMQKKANNYTNKA